jgi:hypothetical protein
MLSCSGASTSSKCCRYGGCCVGNTSITEVNKLRLNFWGSSAARAPSTKQRGELIEKQISNYYNATSKSIEFSIGDRKICERGFLVLLGI